MKLTTTRVRCPEAPGRCYRTHDKSSSGPVSAKVTTTRVSCPGTPAGCHGTHDKSSSGPVSAKVTTMRVPCPKHRTDCRRCHDDRSWTGHRGLRRGLRHAHRTRVRAVPCGCPLVSGRAVAKRQAARRWAVRYDGHEDLAHSIPRRGLDCRYVGEGPTWTWGGAVSGFRRRTKRRSATSAASESLPDYRSMRPQQAGHTNPASCASS